jgi:site-specific DNA recombinase
VVIDGSDTVTTSSVSWVQAVYRSLFIFHNISMTKKCFIYCRVSSPKQAQEGESLSSQEKICKQLINDRGFDLANEGVYLEPFSGRKNSRPVYDQMLYRIKHNPGLVDTLVIRMIDRFTRAGSLAYEIMKKDLGELGVSIIDSTGIIQPSKNLLEHMGFEYDWSISNPSEIAELITANYGNQEVKSILMRLIPEEIRLVQSGYQIGPANDGFLNKKIRVKGKKRVIQIPDSEREYYYKKIFEMRASNRYTDKEIVDELNSVGFKTKVVNKWDKTQTEIIGRKGGKLLSVKQLQRIVQRPIYCGIVVHKWTHYKPIKAKFEGLVDVDTFNRANKGKIYFKELDNDKYEVLYDYEPIREFKKLNRNNPLFPFKFILCSECNKPFLGSSSKGKSGKYFPAYHCSRGHKRIGVKKEIFEENIEEYVRSLKFSKEFLEGFGSNVKKVWRERQEEVANMSTLSSQNLSELKIKQEAIIDNIYETTSSVVRKRLESKVETLEEEILSLEFQRNSVEMDEGHIDSFLKCVKFFMEHPYELLLDKQNLHQQQALFRLVFEEIPTYQNILDGTPKLSLILQQKRTSSEKKSQSVIRLGFEPRTVSLKGYCSTS